MRNTLRTSLLFAALSTAAWTVLCGPAAAQAAPVLSGAIIQTSVQVGDTYAAVIAKRGKPAGEIMRGDLQFLTYPDATLTLRNGIVVEVRASAGPAAGQPAASGPKAPPGALGTAHPMTLAKDEVEVEITAFRRQVRALFEADKFQQLDTIARGLIGDRALFDDGSWKICHLHGALKLRTDAPEATWAAEEDRYARWEDALPDSVTARAAHVGYLCAYAWKARGSGWSRDVKEDAWPLFENRLAQAYIIYQGASQMTEKSPMLWGEASRIALGQSWPQAEMLSALAAAKRAEPAFWYYDGPASVFLLPRWFGAEGDWEAFAKDEMALPGRLGIEEYARTVWYMHAYYNRSVFSQSHADWPMVREGFGRLKREYPRSKLLLNEYAVLAVQSGDRAEARAALAALGGVGDPDVWTQKWLDECVAWAYGGGG